MKGRFEGEGGQRLLLEAISKQEIVQQDADLAAKLISAGELIVFPPEANIVTQGNSDNDVFFFLVGEANIFVNDRYFGTRSEGMCIGEMAAIEPAAPRSATVRSKTEVVALRISEPKFRDALEACPRSYRFLAQMLAKRLRQRTQLVQPPNSKPMLFIGCSTEALQVANEIQAAFKHDKFDTIVWAQGVFGPSGIAIESLCQVAEKADFAAFVISPDDTVISREKGQLAPRDNVIFEMGLFIGVLERSRVFLIKEQHTEVKIPSDLLGVNLVTYILKGGELSSAVGPACTEMRNVIQKMGVR